jgi:hypothetical protein
MNDLENRARQRLVGILINSTISNSKAKKSQKEERIREKERRDVLLRRRRRRKYFVVVIHDMDVNSQSRDVDDDDPLLAQQYPHRRHYRHLHHCHELVAEHVRILLFAFVLTLAESRLNLMMNRHHLDPYNPKLFFAFFKRISTTYNTTQERKTKKKIIYVSQFVQVGIVIMSLRLRIRVVLNRVSIRWLIIEWMRCNDS